MKNKAKEYWPYLAVVLMVILPWFFHSGYIFMTDMAWGPHINLDWTEGMFLTSFIVKVFSFILPMDFIQKVYIGLILFGILMSGKKIAELFTKDRLAVFSISLFVLFNPFVYDRLMYGQANVAMSLGFFLLSFSYLFQYLESRNRKTALYYGIFTALMLQFSVHFVFFGAIIFILFLILYFKKWGISGHVKQEGYDWDWKISLKHVALVAVTIFLLNANWFLAMPFGKSNVYNFVDSGITKQDFLAFKTSGSSDSQVLGNVTMMSGFWGKDQYRYMDLTMAKGNWGRSFLFLLPIIIFGLVWGIRKRETRLLSIGLFVIFLTSVLLASGIALSFSAGLSYWLFDNFPLYKGLRESQKWVAVIVLVYTIFLSIGLSALLKTKIFLSNRFLILILLSIVIIMQAPSLLWGFGRQVKVTPYPVDWVQVDRSLECQNGDNALFLPWHMYMGFSWIGNVVANPAKSFFSCPIISGSNMEWGGIYDNSRSIQGKKVSEWLNLRGRGEGRDGGDSNLLNVEEFSIKYIILAKELDWQNYLWIDSLPNITLLKDTKTLRVYKVNR